MGYIFLGNESGSRWKCSNLEVYFFKPLFGPFFHSVTIYPGESEELAAREQTVNILL